MCKVDESKDNKPFVVAIFCGNSKPSNLHEFLSDFIDEFISLKENYSDIIYPINLKSIICDASARAFLKCIKNHNAYFGCEKCMQKGKWLKRVTFPDCDSPKRKDNYFVDFNVDDDDNERNVRLLF